MQREHEGVSEREEEVWRGGDKGGTGIIWTPAKQTFIIIIWMNGADWSSDSSLSRNAHQWLEDLHDRHTSQLHCEYKQHISHRARGPPHSRVMKMWQSPNLSLWLSSRNIRLAHWYIHHQLRHNGLVPLVIVTLEPRAFKVHKSWGGLDIRPPQYFIHTMSFNQDQSSAKEHMGPTDAALIPLGFFFCLAAGLLCAPCPPVCSAVRSVTSTSSSSARIGPRKVGNKAAAPSGGAGWLFTGPVVWAALMKMICE